LRGVGEVCNPKEGWRINTDQPVKGRIRLATDCRLDKLDAMPPPDLLITRMRFGTGGSHGLSLANMARHKHPDIKIIFTASREFERDVAGLGTFLAAPDT
jgi:hypothetical protein